MNIEFAAKGPTPSDTLKERVENKLTKIEQRLGQQLYARVRFGEAANGTYSCAVHFNGAGHEFTADATAGDLFKAADEALNKIERQVRKAQTRHDAQRSQTIRGAIQ